MSQRVKHAGLPPRALRDWLCAGGSLTEHLSRLGGTFEVQRLRQGSARWLPGEREALGGCVGHARAHAREVLLRVDGEPLVLARSVASTHSLRGPWRALRGLGTRPLAAILFADPRVQRSPLRSLHMARGGAWSRRMCKLWRQATGSVLPAGWVWARASTFERRGERLQVLELFSPALLARPLPPLAFPGKP